MFSWTLLGKKKAKALDIIGWQQFPCLPLDEGFPSQY